MDFNAVAALSIPALLFLFPLVFLGLRRSQPLSTRRVPSPPSLPIVGHLYHLLSSPSPPHHVFAHLAEELKTDILILRLGQVPTVVVSSPHLAREVLKTQDHVLASRPALLSAQYLSFGCSDVTFSPLGPYWRQVRRICVSELLSPRRVASFGAIRREEVDHLLRSVAAEAGPNVDMSKRFFALANNVLCRVAFGRRFENGEDGGKMGLVAVLQESQRLFAGFDAAEFFPGILGEVLNAATGLRRRLERNLADLRAVGDQIIREHRKKRIRASGEGGEAENEDFVNVLLRVQNEGGLEVPITDDNLKALVMDMFVAGTDTTSATLEWVMTELSRHPEAMKKAQEEVRAAVAGRKGATVEEIDISHLRYLKAVVKETLRLHPPAPLLVPREATEACVVGEHAVPAGTRVLVNVYALGRSPTVWDRPLEFLPERFEDEEKAQEFRFLPFGGGRRGCPGSTFAQATIELTLAKILFHFDWSLPAGLRPEDVNIDELFGLATRKKTPLLLAATMKADYSLEVRKGDH